jgi:hypothetical protein
MKYLIGLWSNKNNPQDLVKSKPMHNLYVFLQKLAVVEKLAKKNKQPNVMNCELCKQNIANFMFIMRVGKDIFTWSNSYKHYLAKHNLMPEKIFMIMVSSLYKSKVKKNKV